MNTKTDVRVWFLPLIVLLGAFFSSQVGASGISIASSCNPVAQSACGLPFPSDLFRNTAGKLNYSNQIMDRRTTGKVHGTLPVATQFPAQFNPATILNESRGFSALGPVAFELPAFPQNEIPDDGAGILTVFEIESLKEVPMHVSLSKVANPQRELREKSPVIIAWPRSRFDFEKRYVAVLLRNHLVSTDLALPQMQPSEGMQKVLNGKASYFLQSAYNPILEAVQRKGIVLSDILSLTYFTVRPESEVVSPLQQMIARAMLQPQAIYDIKKRESLGSKDYEYATYAGHLQLVNFRAPDGGIYPPFQPIPDTELERVEFILSLPKPANGESVPVTLWGHGLANDKTLAKSAFTRYDDLGMATFAIDHPNHASRVITSNNKAPHIAVLVHSPQNMMQLLGMCVQSTVDFAVSTKTVHDVLPGVMTSMRSSDPDIPSIDNERLVYQGVSLGGMIGATVGATSPYLKGAFLINGASSLMEIFSESVMWDGNTSMIIPFNANGAEAVFILAMMQHYIDIGDGNNFAQQFRQPPAGQEPRKLGMLYAVGDGSLTNSASLATAEIAGLPLLKEVIQPVSYLPYGFEGADGHVDGYGILQSSFGSEDADSILKQIQAFDPTAQQDSNYAGILQKLAPLLAQFGPFSDLAQLVDKGWLSDTQSTSLSDWISRIYQGDIESFLTHFNRNSPQAVTSNINWACDLLALNPGRCEFARQKALKAAEQNDTQTTPPSSDLIDEAQDALDKFLETGTITVKVESGSGGSVDEWLLGGMSTFLGISALLRVARPRKISPQPVTYRLQLTIQKGMTIVRSPAVRTLGSAILSLLTWGGWAWLVNGWSTHEGMRAGASQGVTSFITTLTGSMMLEWLFLRFGPQWRGCVASAAVVSSISLSLMLVVHINMHTPNLFFTIAPIYFIVVLFCTSYVVTLRKLALREIAS